MASAELLKFNEQFPNSKYREIKAQYVGPMNTDEDKQNYQKSKAPLNTKILTFDEIKDTKNRIGWIVSSDYIVIDIDNKTNAKYVFDILQGLKIKFGYMLGRKGGHFIFKNQRGVKSISAGMSCALGIVVDVRCNEKGYIILPENDTDRKWGRIDNDVDDVPFFLVPLKNFKPQSDFIGMGEGSGRNDALLKHITALIDYAKELTINEKSESVRIINNYLFASPLTDVELNKTVLRDDILNKEDKSKEEKGCYEERLADKIVKDKQIITSDGVCYRYNGKYYEQIPNNTEIERLIHTEYNSNLKQSKRVEIINFIKLKSYVPNSELNKNWNEIVFRNGVLNIATMTMTPHTPSVYNTIYIDCNYIPDAPYSPIIDQFFNTISNKEQDKKSLLYEIVGYCLLRKNVFEKFFICYGGGGTGKSTYLNLITNLIGVKNAAFESLSNLEDQWSPANLYGKLINMGDDIPYRGLKETDMLKKLVTGQMISAARKYVQEPLNFHNFAKLIFTTNSLPEVHDRTSGFYRRVILIGIDHKIENPDHFFLERLTEQDYEYLLSVAVDHVLHALKINKLTECESSINKLQEYKTSQSSVLSFLSDFGYNRDKLEYRPCMDLFKEYEQYCRDTGFKALKKVNFDKELCEELKMAKRNTTWKEDKQNNQCWRFV